MLLDPQDDTTGYEGKPAVVGQLRLDKDGWFNYFGFPEKPMPESPFQFRHSGTVVKALTYGNLGTGGLSRGRRSSRRCRTITRAAASSPASARTSSSTGRSTRPATTACRTPTARRCCRAPS